MAIGLLQGANAAVPSSCSAAGQVALTFDQGPSDYTGKIVNNLGETKAAFHFTTSFENNAVLMAYANQAYAQGHLIGLRTSIALENLTQTELVEYFQTEKEKLESLVNMNEAIRYLRVGYNEVSDRVVKAAKMADLVLTSFNLDSYDYRPNATAEIIEQNVEKVVETIDPPALGDFVIKQISTVAETANATPFIVDYLKEKGYSIVRLDECVGIPVTNPVEPTSPTTSGPTTKGPTPTNRQEGNTGELSNPGSKATHSFAMVTFFAGLVAFLF